MPPAEPTNVWVKKKAAIAGAICVTFCMTAPARPTAPGFSSVMATYVLPSASTNPAEPGVAFLVAMAPPCLSFGVYPLGLIAQAMRVFTRSESLRVVPPIQPCSSGLSAGFEPARRILEGPEMRYQPALQPHQIDSFDQPAILRRLREYGAVLEAMSAAADEARLHIDREPRKAVEAFLVEGSDRLAAAKDPVGRDDLGIAREMRHEPVEVPRALIRPIGHDPCRRCREGAASTPALQIWKLEVRQAALAHLDLPAARQFLRERALHPHPARCLPPPRPLAHHQLTRRGILGQG